MLGIASVEMTVKRVLGIASVEMTGWGNWVEMTGREELWSEDKNRRPQRTDAADG